MGSNDNSYNAQRLNPMRTGSIQHTSGNTSSSLGHTGSSTRTDLGHTGSSLGHTASSRATDLDATTPTVGQPQTRTNHPDETAAYDTATFGTRYDLGYNDGGYGTARLHDDESAETYYGTSAYDAAAYATSGDASYGTEYESERPAYTSQYVATRTPYVRKPRPRKTQEAIDDLADDNTPSAVYAHDSNVAVGGATPLAGRPYARSRSDMGKLQRDLHYGQYLEIPKGKRQIFASRQRSKQIRSRIIMGAILVVLALVAVFAFSLLTSNA